MVQIIHIIQIIEIEASGANNPDYVDYKRHSKATMWLLISSFLRLLCGLYGLVTIETAATFNPQCGFSL